eukprot:TRINITY_DN38757_c0_g1_i1.p1 TRINITY_DN38757_c0_g1~~TRINITY_DN38757_c0_g1_i1.p1  ORF type:complete len:411 (+),score=87.44 TRINITY_DN38757_c0_g1_i1:114-1235(+)
MTEWWVSQAKHWCKVCKVWTGGHKSQILKHEGGRGHIENEQKMLKSMRERETGRVADEKDLKRQLEEIERKAMAAMAAQPASAASSGASHSSGPGSGLSMSLGDTIAAEKRAIQEKVEAAKRRKTEAAPDGAASAWTRHTDPNSGASYYYNSVTKESSWQPPPGFSEPSGSAAPPPATGGGGEPAAAAAAMAAAAGQPGQPASGGESAWVVCTDPNSGNVYYYNRVTQVSSWTKPADLAIDLSAPPPPPSRKPPPPPAKAGAPDKASAAPQIGGWQVVQEEESVFTNPFEIEAAQRFDEEEKEKQNAVIVNPIAALKYDMEKRSRVDEDYEMRAKTFCEKKSNQGAAASKPASFPIARKKASGIRKRAASDEQ